MRLVARWRMVLYQDASPTTGWDLWLKHVGRNEAPVPLVRTRFAEMSGTFSPDARWIAFASNEGGTTEVYVRARAGGLETRVSTAGGTSPRWRADGHELIYTAPDGSVMAAVTETSTELRVGTPHTLFTGNALKGDIRSLSVAPDGKSFLISVEEKNDTRPLLNVFTNWQ
jgi:TolB protein